MNNSQIIEKLPQAGSEPASPSDAGVMKLYDTTGNNTDGTMSQASITNKVVPSGGDQGQVLTKASNTDNDVTWTTPSGGGGTGNLSLISRSSIDDSAYVDDLGYFLDFPEIPVLAVFDSSHPLYTALTPSMDIRYLFAMSTNTLGDSYMMPLSAKVFVKGSAPEIVSGCSVNTAPIEPDTNASLSYYFAYNGKEYYVKYLVAIDVDMETGDNVIIFTEALYHNDTDGVDLTESEFYDIVDRVIVYFSASASEFIMPINLLANEWDDSDLEGVYADAIYGSIEAYLNQWYSIKIVDYTANTDNDFYYYTVSRSDAQISGIRISENGDIYKFSWDTWVDEDENEHYIKVSEIFSPTESYNKCYKWSEIKDDLATTGTEMYELLVNQKIPITLMVDETISGQDNISLGLYSPSIGEEGGILFTMMYPQEYVLYVNDITITPEIDFAQFNVRTVSWYTPE